MNGIQRIIGKHALIVAARGNTEMAAQVFVYDQIREIRLNLEKLEVRILMTYDKDYFKVFSINNENIPKERAIELTSNFYNNLLNASMKLSEEEIENLRKHQIKSKEDSETKETENE